MNFDIQLHDIQLTLPDRRPLFALNELQIPFGSHILIQGESGLGKTTLLHLLAGLLKPNQGSVRIGRLHLEDLNDHELCDMRRSVVGLIFQKLNLLDHLTCRENVLLSFLSGGADSAQQALARVGLKGRENDLVSHLSLGEQQRVAAARVLASRPPVVLADEPTSSLDQTNTDLIISALKESMQGRTLIVVSHDHRLAPHFDRVLDFRELIS